MGEDQPGARELSREPDAVAAERRDAAAGVDQHARPALVGERHELAHRRLAEHEALGARVQLDAAGARVQAPPRLGERVRVGVDAAERHEPAAGRRGGLEHAVVGRPVAGRLVEREDDRAGVGAGERRQQLLRRLRHPVGIVGADVGVRVEQLEAGDVAPEALPPGRHDRVDVGHRRLTLYSDPPRWPILVRMHFRRERVRIETERHEIEATLQLPHEGFRSRTSDFLNAHEREFLPLTDVEVRRLDGSRSVEHHDFLALAVRHVVLVVELQTLDIVDDTGGAPEPGAARRGLHAAPA